MTTTNASLITTITSHVRTVGASPVAARAATRWATRCPALAGFAHPGAVAAAGVSAGPAGQDRLLRSLLRVGGRDEWAELTVLAILGPRVTWVVSRWAAAGVPAGDLADVEADLVTETLTVIRGLMGDPGPPPLRPGLLIVDRAWLAVRDRRRVTTRRHTHHDPPDTSGTPRPDRGDQGDRGDRGDHGDPRTGADLLAAAISDARTAGTVGAGPARALFLTRGLGLTTIEAAVELGTGPGSVRALRSRAARQITTHLGLDPDPRLGRREVA
jgi:hypothetical protein